MAGRITLGLLIASSIRAADLLMRVPTTFTRLGYPGFAMIFLAAAAGAVALAVSILTHDRPRRTRASRV